jgi:hypothetical protein
MRLAYRTKEYKILEIQNIIRRLDELLSIGGGILTLNEYNHRVIPLQYELDVLLSTE